MGVGFLELSLVVFVSLFISTCSPTFLEHLCICYADARGCLAWASLGIILFLRIIMFKVHQEAYAMPPCHAMPSFPVPPIMLLTDVVPRCRLLAAHGLMSCLSARTQPLTATGAPSQTSTIPCHTKTAKVVT